MTIRVLVYSVVVLICLLTTFFCRHAYVDVAHAYDWAGNGYWVKFFFVSCLHVVPGMVGLAISLRRSQKRFLLWSIPTISIALMTLKLWYAASPSEFQGGVPLAAQQFHFSWNPIVFLNPLFYFYSVQLYNLRQVASFVFFTVAFLDIYSMSRSHKHSKGSEQAEAVSPL